VKIVNHDEYEKNQNFIVELGEPRHITSDKPREYFLLPSQTELRANSVVSLINCNPIILGVYFKY